MWQPTRPDSRSRLIFFVRGHLLDHSSLLLIAYASACALWWGLQRVLPLWPEVPQPRFNRPWLEVSVVLLAVLLTIVLGQLWGRGIRLPNDGTWGPMLESVNQIVIFSPIVAVPIIRNHGWSTAWIRPDRVPARLGVGIGLALLVLLLYSLLEQDALSWPAAVRDGYSPARAHIAVQVLLEDLSIAILFVRLAAALGTQAAILGVAALFAAAHIPALTAEGMPAAEILGLLRDFGLGVLVLGTLWRSADILWIWPVHYTLDVTQFLGRGS